MSSIIEGIIGTLFSVVILSAALYAGIYIVSRAWHAGKNA